MVPRISMYKEGEIVSGYTKRKCGVDALFAIQQWKSDMFHSGGPEAAIIMLRGKDTGARKQTNKSDS